MNRPQESIDPARLRAMLAAADLGIPDPELVGHLASLSEVRSRCAGDMSSVVADQVDDSGLPAGAGLLCVTGLPSSHIAADRSAWIPMAAALAASDAVSGIRVLLAWPSDLVVQAAACGGAKGYGRLGGIGVAHSDQSVTVTLRINGDISSRDLPEGGETSLLAEGADLDRTALLGRYLIALARRMRQLTDDPDAVRRDYAERCITIGRLDGEGRVISGIDAEGELVIR